MSETRFLKPQKHISQKVRPGGPSMEQAILQAVNAADDLIGQYQGWAVDDLEALWQSFVETSRAGRADPLRLKQLYDMTHEARGQGGSFGFPLISVVGDSMCKYLEGRPRLKARDLDVVRVHIMAMKAVFRQGLKGHQGALSKELHELLGMFRAKVAQQQAG
ncbi:MAG: hypothetical protein RIG67_23360 [Rhodospirillales bacterium]